MKLNKQQRIRHINMVRAARHAGVVETNLGLPMPEVSNIRGFTPNSKGNLFGALASHGPRMSNLEGLGQRKPKLLSRGQKRTDTGQVGHRLTKGKQRDVISRFAWNS